MRGDDAYAILKKKMQDMQGEKIQESVNRYFDEHPVQAGATAEQVQQIEQNKKDVNSLREDLSTKITKFYASSQGETHLADSDNGKITDMVLYGRSEQKQYSGKNLVKATLESTTKNGITCTNNGDGTYTLNGTANGGDDTTVSFNVGHMIAKSGKYIVVGCPKGGSSEKYNLRIGKDNIPWGTYLSSDLGNGCLIDVTENTPITLTFMIKTGHTCNNVLFKPMIVDASLYPDTTYDDFEPYTGGIPSPNPDYPQEIKSVVNPTVKVCGKNLFDKNNCYDNKWIKDLQGNLGISNGFFTTNHIFVKKGATVAIRKTGTARRGYFNISKTKFTYTESTNTTFTAIEDCWLMVSCNKAISPIEDFQIELGSTPTAYEPYHEQTVALPYTLNAVPVETGGNVTIDGQQYIADYVDVERGKLVKMVDDVEAKNYIWDLYPGEINMPRRFGMNDTIRFNMPADIRIMSSHFKQIATNTRTDLSTWFQTYYIAITDMNEKWKNSEALIQWFSENNVHFYLPLKTPKEIDLTSEEIAAFKTLVTYYPTTNISVNSEQLDGYTVFNYPISMANGWNYVKKQLNDNRDYIYDMDIQSAEAYVNSEYAVALTELEV